MAWPEATDYNEAIQNPAVCFLDPELKQGRPEVNALGWPLPCSGNFAAVYKVFGPDGTPWAVKCFTREVPGLRERYHAISAHLRRAKLPFTVDFEYLEQGIRIHGNWYAVVKMRWVEGLTLNDFLKGQLDKPQLLERLSALWLKLARELRRAGIAHADLQHGNVLLVPGGKSGVLSVRLIDYDGMYVPALADRKPGEVGHANYQHPERARRGAYDAEGDRFPHLVIYTALRALLCGGRALWERHDNGENLLFREQDFANPAQSPLFRALWQLPDPAVRGLTTHLARACQGNLAEVPLLSDVVETGAAREPAEVAVRAQPAPAVLGVLEPGVQQPLTVMPVVRPAAAAETPTTVEPVGLRRRAAPYPAPSRLDTRMLILVVGGAAALLLVAVIGLIIAVANAEPDRPPPVAVAPPRPPLPVAPVDEPAGGGGFPGGGDVGLAPRVRGVRVPDVTLFAGETRTIEISVDRGEHKGRLELFIRETARGGMAAGPAMPMPLRGPGAAAPATLEVDKSVVLLPGQVKAPLRVTAAAGMRAEVREFAVESGVDGPAQAGFGPGPAAPGPAAGPPGAKMPGGMRGAGAGPVLAVFKVTVRRTPRSNPEVLPVGNLVAGRPTAIQIDVVRGGILALDYNPAAGTVIVLSRPGPGGVGEPQPAPVLVPQRLVVVSATFPYRDQVEAFRKALRVATVEELFADPASAPRFVGLDIQRREVQADGGRTPWEPRYRIHPDSDRVTLDPAIDKLLREATYDDGQGERAAAASFPGLATPLPARAMGKYPRLLLNRIDGWREEEGGSGGPALPGVGPGPMNPRGPGFGRKGPLGLEIDGAGATLVRVPVRRFSQTFQDRLAGKFFAFGPYGVAPKDFGAEFLPPGPSGVAPLRPPGRMQPGGPVPPPGAGAERVPTKCLVRFFDAGVRPGKVYEYAIKVCMANPNRGQLDPPAAPPEAIPNPGKPGFLDGPQEANPRHLFSPVAITPSVRIGPDYHVYAVDPVRVTAAVKGPYSSSNRGVDTSPATAHLAAVQIHSWLGDYVDRKGTARRLGDWLVAERLLVPRGELLARLEFLTPVPEWKQAQGRFEFAAPMPAQGRKPPKTGTRPAILLDLDPQWAAPVLVDFRGGRRSDYRIASGLLRDEGAAELLVLTPDGTLELRSGHEDAAPDTPRGRERLQRFEAWRQVLQEIRDRASGAGGLTPFGPKN